VLNDDDVHILGAHSGRSEVCHVRVVAVRAGQPAGVTTAVSLAEG